MCVCYVLSSKVCVFCVEGVVHTVLEGVGDDDVGFVGLQQNGPLGGAEEDYEGLGTLDGGVLDVVHDRQTARLGTRTRIKTGQMPFTSPIQVFVSKDQLIPQFQSIGNKYILDHNIRRGI